MIGPNGNYFGSLRSARNEDMVGGDLHPVRLLIERLRGRNHLIPVLPVVQRVGAVILGEAESEEVMPVCQRGGKSEALPETVFIDQAAQRAEHRCSSPHRVL